MQRGRICCIMFCTSCEECGNIFIIKPSRNILSYPHQIFLHELSVPDAIYNQVKMAAADESVYWIS